MLSETKKAAFWTLVLATVGILSIPSAILWESAQRYRSFLSGFEPPARPRTLRPKSLPHGGGSKDGGASLHFAEFRIKAPKARQVALMAEFAHWRKDALRLTRQSDGFWEIMIPLPRGRYRYFFLVDGTPRLDPSNPRTEPAAPGLSSVREVP